MTPGSRRVRAFGFAVTQLPATRAFGYHALGRVGSENSVPFRRNLNYSVQGGHSSQKNFCFQWYSYLIGATAVAVAQNYPAVKNNGTMIWGKHARMTLVAEPAPTRATTNIQGFRPGHNLRQSCRKIPQGPILVLFRLQRHGSVPPQGEQWMAAAFRPAADHTVTTIEVAVGYSQGKTNGVVLSLNSDNNGVPGKALKTWNASGLPRFGTCCTLVVKSDSAGITVSAGKQYWVVLSTNSHELDTVDAWNVIDTDQVDSATVATYPGTSNKWETFQTTPGLGFAIKGSN